jgi:dipeptidyl aminopeptidase/acylaminoacyl peptidase
MPILAPYGTWRSPISADAVARAGIRLSSVTIDSGDVYWLEGRPHEAGRYVLVRRDAVGRVVDVTPPGTNVRTRVHEYGGGFYLVSRDFVLYTEFTDQRMYRLPRNPTRGAKAMPTPITPPGPWRYADGVMHPHRPLLVCVREDHVSRDAEPVNSIVAVPLDGGESPGEVVVGGHDFYAYPRFSPDGSRLLWIAWRHPRMPWEGTELWVADVLPAGGVANARHVAGGATESIFQPGWSPDGTVYFVSDQSGWWNLYRERGGSIEAVCPANAEFGHPLWQFGMSTWACADPSRMVVTYGRRGRWRLATIDTGTGCLVDVPAAVESGTALVADATHAVFVGHRPLAPDAVVRVELETGAVEVLRLAADATIDTRYLCEPRSIEFPTEDGQVAYGLFYAPRNADYGATARERPPLIVVSHGGPTAAASSALSLGRQYWTSRGFAVVEVDYRGSTGYGRAYREYLNGRWGVVDVTDCLDAARYLVAAGEADSDRLIIRGHSAGGYTTLAALAFHPGVFKAGASYYGVSDLEVLVRDTHKFESRYGDSLIGSYPARRDLYIARSPIHAVNGLDSALILFQGVEDRIVPPSQAQIMADAARANGLPVSLLLFEGEQHGFRRTETIRRSLEAELYFYGVVFGFTPADDLPPIPIDNVNQMRGAR